jgi:hypothetical protein
MEAGAFGERVLIAPEVLQAFLWVTPPFGLLDEVELSDGEVGIVIGFSPERPCLPTVRISRDVNGTEIPSGQMKIKILSAIGNERGHLRVFRQAGRRVDGCFYKL